MTSVSYLDLARDLSQALEGEVGFDPAHQALYATDASNYRQVPIGVVFPKTDRDVLETIRLCRKYDAPILSRGAGTSLAGQCCNTAVILDMSRHYNRILSIDPVGRTARIQPGIVLDHLKKELHPYGLTFGPDPASHSRCTLGGMMGNNSCGVHALVYGKTVDNIVSLKIALYDGTILEVGATSDAQFAERVAEGGRTSEIYQALRALRDKHGAEVRSRFPQIPRRVSGYNLDALLPENQFDLAKALIGSEGTCVTILEATLRLVEDPPQKVLTVIGFPTVFDAADAVMTVKGCKPYGLEGMDDDLVHGWDANPMRKRSSQILPDGTGWLMVETAGQTREECFQKAAVIQSTVQATFPQAKVLICQTAAQEREVWHIRESALALTAFVPGKRPRYEGWDDAAVPPEKLASYIRDYRALCVKYNYDSALYGHFGDGCLHTRVSFDLISPDGIKTSRQFLDEAADLVVRYGGSLSGEHGDGQGRAELFPKMFGPTLVKAFEEFKAVWDPTNRMNPGKMVHAFKIMDNLRLRKNDFEGFSGALIKCVGVGACRKEEAGTMCPSYRATKDEKHSTRGRAHLLYEMLRGEIIQTGWRSPEVKEALDLCLACKACKTECPTSIDMATYKSEFLYRFYQGRLRPLSAYAFGFIFKWVPLASLFPRLVNAVQASPLGSLGKWILGVHAKRRLPPFAVETFRAWFQKQAANASASTRSVILWPDTFTNHYEPGIAQAATRVLTAAGFQVKIPTRNYCCGRPLYDFGFVDQAKKQLEEILIGLKDAIQNETPIVVLEPSCASVFRDELIRLFPDKPEARALARQTFLLGEFLLKFAPSFKLSESASAARTYFLKPHCHETGMAATSAEASVLRAAGVPFQNPEVGCCGMAGAFGYEKDHYEVSQACAQHQLAPALQTNPDQPVIADGFSCRLQIRSLHQGSVHHLAQVLDPQPPQ